MQSYPFPDKSLPSVVAKRYSKTVAPADFTLPIKFTPGASLKFPAKAAKASYGTSVRPAHIFCANTCIAGKVR